MEQQKEIISEEDAKPENAERREFMFKAGSVCHGIAVAIPPIAARIAVLMDLLRCKQGYADFTRVTLLDALPGDGTPKKFTIYAEKQDAWNKFPKIAIGRFIYAEIAMGKSTPSMWSVLASAGLSYAVKANVIIAVLAIIVPVIWRRRPPEWL